MLHAHLPLTCFLLAYSSKLGLRGLVCICCFCFLFFCTNDLHPNRWSLRRNRGSLMVYLDQKAQKMITCISLETRGVMKQVFQSTTWILAISACDICMLFKPGSFSQCTISAGVIHVLRYWSPQPSDHSCRLTGHSSQ